MAHEQNGNAATDHVHVPRQAAQACVQVTEDLGFSERHLVDDDPAELVDLHPGLTLEFFAQLRNICLLQARDALPALCVDAHVEQREQSRAAKGCRRDASVRRDHQAAAVARGKLLL